MSRYMIGEVEISFSAEAGKVYVVRPDLSSHEIVSLAVVATKRSKVEGGVIPQLAQPDRAAEIYFIREWRFSASGLEYKLIFDGVEFFRVRAGEYTMIKANPGKHWVGIFPVPPGYSSVYLPSQHSREYDFQPGTKYYFAVTSWNSNKGYGHDQESPVSLIPLSTSDGEVAVKKCRYTPYMCK